MSGMQLPLMFAVRAVGTALTFAVSLYISRLFGAAELGIYSLFVSLCAGLVLVTKLGTDTLLTREIAAARALGDHGRLYGFLLTSLVIGTAFSATVIVLLALGGQQVITATLLEDNRTHVVGAVMLALLPATLWSINLGALRGAGRVGTASALEMLVLPGLIILAIAASISAVSAYVLAICAGAVLSLLLLARALPAWQRPTWPALPAMGREGWFIVGIAVIDFFANWSATYYLAAFGSAQEVGIYTVCWRLVIAINMLMLVLDQINAPTFSALHARGDNAGLERCVRRTATLGAAAAAPLLGVLVLAAPLVLSWFGDEFIVGAEAVMVLALGQFISLCCGSVGYLLIMTGHGRALRNINLLVLAAQWLSLPWLIRAWGIEGAAIASAASVAITKLLAAFFASRFLQIKVHPSLDQLRDLWLCVFHARAAGRAP